MGFTIPGYNNAGVPPELQQQGMQGGVPYGGDPTMGAQAGMPYGGDPTMGGNPYGGGMPGGMPYGADPTMGGNPYAGGNPYGGGYPPQQQMPDPYANGYTPYGVDQNYAYGAQQFQGQVQAPVGRVDKYGMVHYTKAQYIEGLRAYVITNSGVQIAEEERLDEYPNLLRHACAPAKISWLPICYFNVPETGVQVPFYFCTACGKLFYFKDFM